MVRFGISIFPAPPPPLWLPYRPLQTPAKSSPDPLKVLLSGHRHLLRVPLLKLGCVRDGWHRPWEQATVSGAAACCVRLWGVLCSPRARRPMPALGGGSQGWGCFRPCSGCVALPVGVNEFLVLCQGPSREEAGRGGWECKESMAKAGSCNATMPWRELCSSEGRPAHRCAAHQGEAMKSQRPPGQGRAPSFEEAASPPCQSLVRFVLQLRSCAEVLWKGGLFGLSPHAVELLLPEAWMAVGTCVSGGGGRGNALSVPLVGDKHFFCF